MPHLDVVSYFTQYMWAVFALLSLFFIVGIGILPILQRQLVARVKSSRGFKGKRTQTQGTVRGQWGRWCSLQGC